MNNVHIHLRCLAVLNSCLSGRQQLYSLRGEKATRSRCERLRAAPGLRLLCRTSMTHHIHDPELFEHTPAVLREDDVTTQADQVQPISPDLGRVQRGVQFSCDGITWGHGGQRWLKRRCPIIVKILEEYETFLRITIMWKGTFWEAYLSQFLGAMEHWFHQKWFRFRKPFLKPLFHYDPFLHPFMPIWPAPPGFTLIGCSVCHSHGWSHEFRFQRVHIQT